MARVAIAVNTLGPHGGGDNQITYTNGDLTNNHTFVNDGETMLLIKNGGASTCNVDIIAVDDEYGRAEDRSLAVGAGDDGIAGPFKKPHWNQSDGVVNVDIDYETSVTLAAIKYNPR